MFKKKDDSNHNKFNREEEDAGTFQFSKGLLIFCIALLAVIVILSFIIGLAL